MKKLLALMAISVVLTACNTMQDKDDMHGDMMKSDTMDMKHDGMMKDDKKMDKMSGDM